MLPREELFFRILIFFAIITAVIGVINISSEMDKENTLTSSVLYGFVAGNGAYTGIQDQMSLGIGIQPYIEGANIAPGIAITGIDFTTASAIDTNTTKIESGSWNLVTGKGLVLSNSILMSLNLGLVGSVYLQNIKSNGNIYTVNYLIDNSEAGGEWHIYPRRYASASDYDLDVVFASDGVHIKSVLTGFNLLLGGGDFYFYPLPGASTTIPGGSTITTILTEIPGGSGAQSSTLTVKKDGTTLFTTHVSNSYPTSVSNNKIWRGGAGSKYEKFIIKGFPSTNMVSTQENVVSNAGGTVANDPLTAIGQFWDLIAAAMGLGGNAFIPMWLSAIIIIPCITVLILIGLEILRGV